MKTKNVAISEALHSQLKIHCAKHGITMREFIERMIENKIKEEQK